jgi:two-component system copper resistance phosphate regulon response regulator CusR
MPPRILVIEDEDKLRAALARGLVDSGYEVRTVADGDEGLALSLSEPFDCIVLDLMLPGRDGFEVLSGARAAGVEVPVLILSARGEVEDRVRGLDTGADDYLAKPFAWAELEARIRVCLRRAPPAGGLLLRLNDLEFDRLAGQVRRGGIRVDLTPREAKLLEYLMERAGRPVDRDALARDVWDDPRAGLTNVIDVYVNYLRRKLDKVGAPGAIRTIRSVGYELRG